MRIATHMTTAFVACFIATALVLLMVHGPGHLAVNPLALVIFLAGAAIAISIVALVLTGVLKKMAGAPFVRLWWRSIIAVSVVVLGLLAAVEISAL